MSQFKYRLSSELPGYKDSDVCILKDRQNKITELLSTPGCNAIATFVATLSLADMWLKNLERQTLARFAVRKNYFLTAPASCEILDLKSS